MNTATDTLETNTPKSGGGYTMGQSATDLCGFYAATPIVQPTSASQAAITNSAGGTASATTGLQALTSSYNSTLLANSFATIVVLVNQLRSDLVALGLLKGS